VAKGVEHLPLLIEQNNRTITAALRGEIDHHNAAGLRNAIDAAVSNAQQPKELILDFSAVTFMDSSGIGLIMGRYKTAKLLNCRLRVVGVPQNMFKIMQLAGLETLCEIKQSEATAR
jgi:stage II sporulation protein AA (anti-sigma F factor antagonist)